MVKVQHVWCDVGRL